VFCYLDKEEEKRMREGRDDDMGDETKRNTYIFLPRDHHLGVFMTLCARQRHCLFSSNVDNEGRKSLAIWSARRIYRAL
jgi:hypothetical protein